ncbi:MAG: universal stress protein [Geminicoccaceae bacterium]
MGYRDLLLTVDDGTDSAARARLASRLAAIWSAHLTAVAFVADPVLPAALGVSIPSDLLEAQAAAGRDVGKASLARVAAIAAEAGVAIEARLETGAVDSMPGRLARMARHADLTIIGQPDPAASGVDDTLKVEAAFLDSGRPALVVPYIGAAAALPAHVLVCWDGSREAARAVGDAMPFLKPAERVTVLVVDAGKLQPAVGELPGADIGRHLARHGVTAEIRSVASGGLGIGDTILTEASDARADLVVMGGYGHSRLRELVLGGATRHLLAHMTVPVLLAH